MKWINYFLLLTLITSCSKEDNSATDDNGYYFPSTLSNDWETITPESINWDGSATEELYDYLSEKDTRAFIVLHKGKIVMEEYWGDNIINTAPFNQNSNWYWASAGKTLTAFLIGMAQEQGLLNIEDKTSDYLGKKWTSLSPEKKDLIKIRHQLTMTTGLDYSVPNNNCTTPECLQYKTDAGDQWFYHNAPYTLISEVLSQAANMTYNDFTDQNIDAKIGMDGNWIKSGDNHVFWSTPRDAARFGLLLLNNGKWAEENVLSDMNYFNAMTNSSQDINPSYGFCTWLNGKSSIIYPVLPISFNVPLSEVAPSDLYAAIGKDGQFIDIIPSMDLVVIRMGKAPDNDLVPTQFHDEMWEKLIRVIN